MIEVTDMRVGTALHLAGDGMIPPNRGLRIIGDVHGDSRAFSIAADTDRFVVQLGDLTDYGPDSAGCLRIALQMVRERRGLFVLGNHDQKLRRALLGHSVHMTPELVRTLSELDDDLRAAAVSAISDAPAWVSLRQSEQTLMFVHGGFHTDMLDAPPPPAPNGRAFGALSRALYGEPTGRSMANGYPERSLRWVDRIPAGMVVYCGHDRRSADGRPYIRTNYAGGKAVFLDTGAGKGGHLSWIDIPPG